MSDQKKPIDLDVETLAEAARLLATDFGAKGADEAKLLFYDDGTIEIVVDHTRPFRSQLSVSIRPKGWYREPQ